MILIIIVIPLPKEARAHRPDPAHLPGAHAARPGPRGLPEGAAAVPAKIFDYMIVVY